MMMVVEAPKYHCTRLGVRRGVRVEYESYSNHIKSNLIS